jgi:N-acetylglucosaminyl-diphospho-decaprenol L-rhamnosyltransferase
MAARKTIVDVVIVSYNSRQCLRRAAESADAYAGSHVIVVDNNSGDGGIETVSDLDVTVVSLTTNGGFAHGCNVGIRNGKAPYVLLLNPDATIDASSLGALVERLESDPTVGAVAPRLVDDDGSLAPSQRFFPRSRTVLAQALFLHRLGSRAWWLDDVARDPKLYESEQSAEWISGACILLRRDILEQIGGLDEGFFHYCEDMDLCRRVRDLGFDIRYVPSAKAIHIGGQSAPRTSLLPRLMSSKLRYAAKHRSAAGRWSERLGLALYALTHATIPMSEPAARQGHRRAFMVSVRGSLPD